MTKKEKIEFSVFVVFTVVTAALLSAPIILRFMF